MIQDLKVALNNVKFQKMKKIFSKYKKDIKRTLPTKIVIQVQKLEKK